MAVAKICREIIGEDSPLSPLFDIEYELIMKTGTIPFQFDLQDLIAKAKRQFSGRVGDVTLNLPFVSFSISPKDQEKKVAREIVIRLRDRRVLSASECCDGCIDSALASLREVRQILVDKQVELANVQDGPLYLLIDTMLAGTRQFMTFEEVLRRSADAPVPPRFEKHRLPEHRQGYFDGLELLREHLSRCLGQVAAVAGMEAPTEGLIANYKGQWNEPAYLPAVKE